jgi:hypothetical protein
VAAPTVIRMPEVDWNRELVDQLDWHWTTFVRRRIARLTDEQYRWEPVPGCWSVRPRGRAVSPEPVGIGEYVLDWSPGNPKPPPFTTIAWRLCHIALVLGERAGNHFGDGDVTYGSYDYPGTAAGALVAVDREYAAWTAGVRALGADGLSRPCGPAEGPYAEAPLAALVLHVNREVLHHSAEVLALLDLYRGSEGGRAFARPEEAVR